MIVVSDTTPLITLLKADQLDILGKLFGEVFIPEAVYSEVTGNESFKEEADIIRNASFIQIVKVQNESNVLFLQRATGLDLGESEAIIYADEIKADILLMDEVAGRRVAQNMNIPITGSIGVLIRAYQSEIITESEADEAFKKIKSANRHISDKLIDSALRIIHHSE